MLNEQEQQEKEIRRLQKERDDLRTEIWKQQYFGVPLEKPIRHGYWIEYIYNEDIVPLHTQEIKPEYLNVLKLVNVKMWCATKDFLRKNNHGKQIKILPKLRHLGKAEYEKLSKNEQRLLLPEVIYRWGNQSYDGYVFRYKNWLVTKITKAYITHSSKSSGELERKLAELEERLDLLSENQMNLYSKYKRFSIGRNAQIYKEERRLKNKLRNESTRSKLEQE